MRGRVGGEDSSAGRIFSRISRLFCFGGARLWGVLGAHFWGEARLFDGARLWRGVRLGRHFLGGAHFFRGGLERRVAATKAAVLARNSEVGFDVLAKSLALNPYQPRFGVAEVAFYEHGGHRIIEAEVVKGLGEGGESCEGGESKNAAGVRIFCESLRESSEESLKKSHEKERPSDIFAALENAAQHPKKAIIADTTMQPNIALVGNLRRYSERLIIHRDIFISRYQILESAVFGADAVVLNAAVLTEDSLESLAFFAQKLGLLCVFEGEDSRGEDSGVADSQIDSQNDSRGVVFLRDLGGLEHLRGEKIVVLGR